jgi:hypothetical protein
MSLSLQLKSSVDLCRNHRNQMEKLRGGIFISPKDIQNLYGWQNIRSAQREHQSIRDALGIGNGLLTLKQFCEYKNLNEEEVISYLNPYR